VLVSNAALLEVRCPCGHSAYGDHGDLRCLIEGCFCDRGYGLAKVAADNKIRLRCRGACPRPFTRVGNECAAVATGFSSRTIIQRNRACRCDCHEIR
jgi:hypothetical protein